MQGYHTEDQNGRYLFIKRGIFYYSRRVPLRLQKRFLRDRIVFSLNTRSLAQARSAAAKITNQIDLVWNQMRLEELGILITHTTISNTLSLASPTQYDDDVCLSDAHRMYLELKGRGKSALFRKSTERNIGYAIACLGDVKITALGRTEAGKFRDFLIARGLTSISIKRVLSTVRAAVNLAISERGLECKNPFSGTFIPEVGEKKIRPPIPAEHIRLVQNICISVDDDKRWLIALISDTGLRLAEAVGLVGSDFHLEDEIPYVDIRIHPWRQLKTPSSVRTVPLVGASLWAAERAIKTAKNEFLFPAYANKNGCNSNSASAALNKWLRQRLPEGCVIHSFRHSMRDRLRSIECPADIVDAIGGWTTQGIGHAYGFGYPLDVKLRWLEQVVLMRKKNT